MVQNQTNPASVRDLVRQFNQHVPAKEHRIHETIDAAQLGLNACRAGKCEVDPQTQQRMQQLYNETQSLQQKMQQRDTDSARIITELRSQLKRSIAQTKTAQESRSEQINTTNSTRQSLIARTREVNSCMDRWNKLVEQKDGAESQYKQRISVVQSKLDTATSQLTRATQQLRATEERLKNLTGKIQSDQNRIAQNAGGYESRIAELTAKYNRQMEAIKTLVAEKRENAAAIEGYKRKIVDDNARHKQHMEGKDAELTSRSNKLRQHYEAQAREHKAVCDRRIAELNQMIARSSTEKSKLENGLAQMVERSKKDLETIAACERRNTVAKQTYGQAAQNNNRNHQTAQAEYERTKKKLQIAIDTGRRTAERLSVAESTIPKLAQNIQHAEEETKRVRRDYEAKLVDQKKAYEQMIKSNQTKHDSAMKNESIHHKAEIERINMQIKKYQNIINEQDKKVRQLEADKKKNEESTKRKIGDLEAKISKINGDYDKKMSEHKTQIEKLSADAKKQNEEMARKGKIVTKLSTSEATLKRKLTEMQNRYDAEIAKYEKTIAQLDAKRVVNEAEIDEMKNTHKDNVTKYNTQEKKLGVAEQNVRKLEKSLAALQSKYNDVEVDVKLHKNATFKENSTQMEKAEQRILKLQGDRKSVV